jgi:hypothetical protein
LEAIWLAAICWAPSAQRRCRPKEALHLQVLKTFSHLLIVSKLLSLSHTHTPPYPWWLLIFVFRVVLDDSVLARAGWWCKRGLRLYSPQLLGGKEKDAGKKEKRERGKGGRGNVTE